MRWAKKVKTGKSSAKSVLTWLADMCGADHTAFPSIPALAEATELNVKTVQASLKHLVEIGLIVDTGDRRGATRQIPVYKLVGIEESITDAEHTQKREYYQKRYPSTKRTPNNTTKNGNVTKIGNVPENGMIKEGNEPKTGSVSAVETIPILENNTPKNGIRNLPRNLKDLKDLKDMSGNSDELPDASDFKSKHPDAAVFTPGGKSWGTQDDLDAAAWIFERVQKIIPTAKQPKWAEWANDIRLMREIDERSISDVCAMYDFASRHDFWHKNILSPSKLRAQWDRLTAERASKKKNDINNLSNETYSEIPNGFRG